MISLYVMDSPNVHKITLMLEELGAAYSTHFVNVWNDGQRTTEFRALNPNGKVPVIIDYDGIAGEPVTIFESGAILLYLAEKFGKFLSNDARTRSIEIQWLMIQLTGVGPMFGQHVHFMAYAPEPIPYAQERYRREVFRLFGLLDNRLDRVEYLGGADYSIADIATYPWINIHGFLGVDLASFPHLDRWKQTIADRPASRRLNAKARQDTELSQAGRKAADAASLDRYFGRVQEGPAPQISNH